jgi:hypothetical protein
MSNIDNCLRKFAYAVVAMLLLSSCMKDKLSKTYTIYTPVYKAKAEVLASIKLSTPRDISAPGKIYVYGNYLFLNEVNKGIHLIDNSNPTLPKRIGFIDIPGNVDIAVKGNVLYADMYADLLTIDISDPQHTKLLSSIPKVFPENTFWTAFTADSNSIIIDWVRKDTTIDLEGEQAPGGCPNCMFASAFSSMDKSSSTNGTGGSMARFTIVNDYLYTVGIANLNVLSIADPRQPVILGREMVGMNIETIFPFKNKLFIGSATGMFIYSIDNPAKPLRESAFQHVRACDPVIADDNYAYVTLRTGTGCGGTSNLLHILDVSAITDPRIVKTYPLVNPHGLAKDGDLLFVCDGTDGLKLYDARDVNNLKLLHHVKDIETYDVIAFNKTLLVVSKNGLSQFDYSDGKSMKLLSTLVINKKS